VLLALKRDDGSGVEVVDSGSGELGLSVMGGTNALLQAVEQAHQFKDG